jgi:hypothetical protein
MVASVKHAPGKFNVPENKVRPFEKLMMMLEGRLFDGMIFQVGLGSGFVVVIVVVCIISREISWHDNKSMLYKYKQYQF